MAEGESAGEQLVRLREEYERMSPEEQKAYREKMSTPPQDIGGEQKAAEKGELTKKQIEVNKAFRKAAREREEAEVLKKR